MSQPNAMPASSMQEFSYASPNNYLCVISRCPNVQFFLSSINIPGIASPAVHTDVLPAMMQLQGDKIEFRDLILEFIIDEYFYNYEEIYRWVKDQANPSSMELSTGSFYADLDIIMLNNNKDPFARWSFSSVFPTELEEIQMSNKWDGTPLTVRATFQYTQYTFLRYTNSNAPSFVDANSVLSNLANP